MSNNPEVIFHIGLHKTGSTFLQKEVFPKINNFHFLGKRADELKDLLYQDILYFDVKKNRILIEKIFKSGVVNLISNEALSGDPQNGGFYRERILEKIHLCFPNAKIILFIRKQNKWAISNYKGSVRNGSNLSLKEFFLPAIDPKQSWKRRYPNPTIEIFKFYPYIKFMVGLFGLENCLILPYEHLKENPDETINTICTFMKVKMPKYSNTTRNYSFGKYRLVINRIFNLFFKKNQNPYGFIKGIPIYNWKKRRCEIRKFRNILQKINMKDNFDQLLSKFDKKFVDKDGICTKILDICKNDNKMIDQELSIGLKKFGYF